MKIKKALCFCMASILCLAALSGCGAKGANDAGDMTAVTGGPDSQMEIIRVGSQAVTVGEFRYYIYETAMSEAYRLNPDTNGELRGFDWDQKTESGETLSEKILAKVVDTVVLDNLMLQKAAEKGVGLSEEEKKSIEQSIDSYVLQSGESTFLLSANSIAVNTIDEYKKLACRMQAVQMAEDAIIANFSDYTVGDELLKNYKSDHRVTAQHILIQSNSEKVADPEETMQEVLRRAKSGMDFTKLMEEFNEDPGETAAGYTFGPGEMVKEFEDASFALELNQISDVVKTEYGYHIIKRVTGLAELQNYWMQNETYTVNRDLLREFSVKDIMETAMNAQNKLQELSKSQTANAGENK